jgi:hypothetical protein
MRLDLRSSIYYIPGFKSTVIIFKAPDLTKDTNASRKIDYRISGYYYHVNTDRHYLYKISVRKIFAFSLSRLDAIIVAVVITTM